MIQANRKQARGRDEERLFRILIDAVDHAIYMLDPDGIVSSWNQGAQRITGYQPGEIIGSHYERFFTPEDRRAGKPRKALETARRVGRFEAEGWRLRKNGARFWAHSVIDAIYDDNGKLRGFAKVTRDTSERRAAEEALWESERRFRLFVNAVVDYGLFMLDLDGRVVGWNPGAERLKGYTAVEITGRHFSKFYTEEDRLAEIPARALETAAREGKYESEGWRVRKDGSRFWANVVIDPVRDEAGRLIGFAQITRDMTEHRKAQLQLEQTREALLQAQKMEAVGQLTGGVAHDFNNILAAIVNSLELARRGMTLERAARRHIDAALQAAHNGAGLVQQMLIFARKQPVKLEPIDVRATIEGLLGLLRHACPENVEIGTELAPDTGFARAAPHQLQTALLNLVINARDAMPEGGTVTIATARTPQPPPGSTLAPGSYVRLSVADTGVGMAPDVLNRAFEPFFTTKEVGKGTGLGLAMVYGALRQMGGLAELASSPGCGTTVTLWLPAAPNAARTAEFVPDEPATSPGTELIFVEDDAIVAMATAEMLEQAGYRVHAAARGEHALELLDAHPGVRILVTDIGLPGMTGHALALEGRRRRPDLKVLFITGHDPGNGGERLRPGHDVEYLGKPYQPNDLFRALHRLDRPAEASPR